jgi:hypothetical protein
MHQNMHWELIHTLIHQRTRVRFVGRFARVVVLVGFRFFFLRIADSAALSFRILISHSKATGATSRTQSLVSLRAAAAIRM